MKREIDLLKFYPKSKRPIEDRGNLVTDIDRAVARKFDVEYYDGDRLTGYGGYGYSPRFWTDTVAHIVDVYSLSNNSKILDIGCAKGYMMHDLSLLIPEAEIKGIDISQYAKDHAIESMQENIVVSNANNLPFPDDYFDLVIAINTLHNLPLIDCKQAFREISRVTKHNSFVMNDAWRNAQGKQSMLNWNLTALTYMSCDDWEKLFEEVGYDGDYYWFFAE
ncbi:class I SAM-dependent methyltransferase [Candidatus Thioglobus sp.]|nr:class I SAM-dependent methyltransferase [Candidatus Thioglobus sp.]